MSLCGILPVNKPPGITSHDVVQKLREILSIKRIGHTGTLDPQASGVLLACVGKATKVVQFLVEYDKEYEARIRLGVTTETYDGEGKITRIIRDIKVSSEQIRKTIDSFKGKIWQIPPPYSAIRYKGKKLYQYARADEQPKKTKKRKVEIKDIKILKMDLPDIELKVSCSKGTYVRSLANDLGERLGCGAHLFSLCRTRVGPFRLQETWGLNQIANFQHQGKIQDVLIPVEKALAHLPSVVVKKDFVKKVKQGVGLTPSFVLLVQEKFEPNRLIAIKDNKNKIIAIGQAKSWAKNFLNPDSKEKLFEYVRVI